MNIFQRIAVFFVDLTAKIKWGQRSTITADDRAIIYDKLKRDYYVIATRRRNFLSTFFIALGHFFLTGRWGFYSHVLMNTEAQEGGEAPDCGQDGSTDYTLSLADRWIISRLQRTEEEVAKALDGFRFDLAPVLGRTANGFDMASETLAAMHLDAVLHDRVLIAEPWDIGPGGYQLGNFLRDYIQRVF